MFVEEVAQISRIKFPKWFKFKRSGRALDLLCLQQDEIVVEGRAEQANVGRQRGTNVRRLKVTTAEHVFGVDSASTPTDFVQHEIDTVLRGRNPSIENGILNLANFKFINTPDDLENAARLRDHVKRTWRAGINYQVQLPEDEDGPFRPGLRKPQIGALHAIAAHWSLSRDCATIVMPTGTGKTEVMLALSVESFSERVLIIVPTDALREQTAGKFLGYGLLKKIGVLQEISNPVVGVLKGAPCRDDFEAMRCCNVLITTMASIAKADEPLQREFSELFSEIFFDEAHHIQANSWKKFFTYCDHARTVLFTATPFREDGKPIPGKIIYNFPLSSAQEQEFFRPIRFLQVFEPDSSRADQEIAHRAVSQLREDIANGHDHLLLARFNKIDDAERVFENVYSQLYPDLNPVVIHSNTRQRAAVLESIRNGHHKIVICVDMFGEGFDLPNLKIAALHSVHKSLGITLQFIGRFARAGVNVGHASFVANTAEDGVPEALEALYQEDADWNDIIADMSYEAIDPQARLSDLVENMEDITSSSSSVEISPLTLRPKISAEVFRASHFEFRNFSRAFKTGQNIHQAYYSEDDKLLVILVRQNESIDWSGTKDISVENWDLFIAHHDVELNLLFIHSTRKKFADKLAAVLSEDSVRIGEDDIFKSFGNIRRLVLHSVGLTSLSRNVRYQMFAGLDVRDAIDPVLQHDKLKSNVMGVGYENGRRVSVGGSRKGKVWSLATGSLVEWTRWCRYIGNKLNNDDMAPDDFLRHTLVPESLHQGVFPDSMAMMIDWPDQLYESATFRFSVLVDNQKFSFHISELRLEDWNPGAGSLDFSIHAGSDASAVYKLMLLRVPRQGLWVEVTQLSGPIMSIDAFGSVSTATDFFAQNPPLVRLADGSQLSGDILLKPREILGEVFDRAHLMTLNWNDTDIRIESRWSAGEIRQNSIQQQFIHHLERGPAQFIIDDDDTGESADVVEIEHTEETVTVTLWHCKYSSGDQPGNRVSDLYEVCGQAQKSVKWAWSFPTLVAHLTERESRNNGGRETRFIRGSLAQLVSLRKAARRKYVVFKVGIVQPGLRAETIENNHLTILGATNIFLKSIINSQLLVYAA